MDTYDSSFWDAEFRDAPDHINVADRFLEVELEGTEPGTALDLGCGLGTNALELARRGWSVVGVDFTKRAIEIAREIAASESLDATFLLADTTEWRPTRAFDLVISTYALPGQEQSAEVLKTARDALARGGTVIVAEWDKSMADVWEFDRDDLASPEQIVSGLSGLEIECAEVRRIDVFSPDDPRAIAGPEANVAFVKARKLSD